MTLALNEGVSFPLQIVLALEEAREKGIVQRDLKPRGMSACIVGGEA